MLTHSLAKRAKRLRTKGRYDHEMERDSDGGGTMHIPKEGQVQTFGVWAPGFRAPSSQSHAPAPNPMSVCGHPSKTTSFHVILPCDLHFLQITTKTKMHF